MKSLGIRIKFIEIDLEIIFVGFKDNIKSAKIIVKYVS